MQFEVNTRSFLSDSMSSEQRQKLAKERREERARYIGEKRRGAACTRLCVWTLLMHEAAAARNQLTSFILSALKPLMLTHVSCCFSLHGSQNSKLSCKVRRFSKTLSPRRCHAMWEQSAISCRSCPFFLPPSVDYFAHLVSLQSLCSLTFHLPFSSCSDLFWLDFGVHVPRLQSWLQSESTGMSSHSEQSFDAWQSWSRWVWEMRSH